MRVAVCFSGQPRTALIAVPSLLSYFKGADFFCHMWDYNSWKIGGWKPYLDEPVLPGEIDRIVDLIQPKKYVVSSISAMSYTEMHWVWRSLYYSMMRANHLKREYEIENGFEYDVVVKVRYDIAFPPHTEFSPMECRDRTIWVEYCDRMRYEYRRINLSDVWMYGDSWGMDVVSDFYRHLSTINDPHTLQCGPGVLLYDHVMRSYVQYERMPWRANQGFKAVIVRKEAEGLDIFTDWDKISDMHMAFYNK